MKLKTATPNIEKYVLLHVENKSRSCVSYSINDSVVKFFMGQIISAALYNMSLCSLPKFDICFI